VAQNPGESTIPVFPSPHLEPVAVELPVAAWVAIETQVARVRNEKTIGRRRGIGDSF
jgi:hypothetical protein